MPIETIQRHVVRCDVCDADDGHWKTKRAAIDMARMAGWHVGARVLCPSCWHEEGRGEGEQS